MAVEREQFALSLSQRNILSLEMRYPGTSINIISATIHISGRVDFQLLAKTLNLIILSDDTMRARIVRGDGDVLQEYVPYSEEQFPVYDFSLTDPDGFSHWETAVTRQPVQLYGEPLCRFFLFRTGEGEGGVLVKTHHIVFDGWSLVLLCNRIARTYLTLLSGKEPEMEKSPDYRLHVEAEREYLASRNYVRDEKYWRALLEKPAESASFKDQRGAQVSPVGRRRSYRLPEILNHAISDFCREHRVSPFAPYYMALAIAAKRMGCGKRMTVGVPVHNRTDLTARMTTGMFVSTLPLVMELDEDWTAEQFCDSLSENWLELLRHQRCPYERIEAMPGRSGRLFSVALSYQDNLSFRGEDATVRFSGRWNYSGYQAEQLCIHMTNLEDHRRYTVDYDYLTQLFTDEEIDRLHRTICSILDQILSHPARPIRDAGILSAREREQVLYTFNRTARRLPGIGLWAAFAARAETCPDRVAVIENGNKLTYGVLRARAQTMGAALAARCGEGPLIAVLLPRGNRLAGVLTAVMAAGGAWLLLSPELPSGRINDILIASGAELVITSAAAMERFGGGLAAPHILAEELERAAEASFAPPAEGPDDLAYVVYTSGSTGAPKGVEITKGNLLNFASGMKDVFPDGAMLSISSVSFDAFMLECVVPLLNGLTVIFADEAAQEDPGALAGLIRGSGVDYMCMTPSRLATFLEYPEFRRALSGRRGILCGGEAFSGELLSELKKLTGAHIYNQYGPSETTVGVSLAVLDSCTEINAGRPMPNCRLYVLDDRLSPLPADVYGELYIGGACVGRGYRGAPELTKKAFLPDPFTSDGMMYRSGDVACWTRSGEVRLRGRTDRQIKLRGQRVEPDELRFCLESYTSVKKAAVRACEQFGQTVLCAYYTGDEDVPETELMRYLADKLPVYLLPVKIIRLDAMPMTMSGKVDEKALPLPVLDGGNTAPETAMQEKILDIFRQVLDSREIGADGDYFLFGGNSLNAMETLSLLEPAVGRRLKISDLYACRTARQLDAWLTGGAAQKAPAALPPIPRAPERESYPLSEIQKSIYLQCRMAPESTAYNMPGVFRLGAKPDRAALERAFGSLIELDDIYRTAFVFENGGLCGKIMPKADFTLTELSGDSMEEVWNGFLKPFDLARPPLIRAGIWSRGDESLLFIDVHHIVGDGVSTPLMLKRLNALYCGGELPPPELTYKDYCVWREGGGDGTGLEDWKKHLLPLPEKLDMPADLPRPHPFDFKGGVCEFTLPDELAARCDSFCAERELTPFMLFSAAWGLLLSRVSGKDAMLVGTPVSGRNRSELWNVCGPFLSTLPLRLEPKNDITAGEYLENVKRETLWMLDHQELPLDRVLTELELPRTLGENPLYQVMFTYRPLDVEELSLAGAPLTVVETPHSTAKAELDLEAACTGGKYCFTLEYASSVFQRPAAEFYCRCIPAVLDAFVSRPEEALGGLDIVPPEDRIRLLDMPKQMSAPFRNVPMDVLFSESARRRPDAPAVIFRDTTVTFRELEERACALAGKLQTAGAVPGGRIGLCCRRGPDIFAGMLAILKTGCAYVPFLPEFPRQRVQYMLETADVHLVLCGGSEFPAAADFPGVMPVSMEGEGGSFVPPETRGGLMYILFTSGSTGKPKGVMVSTKAAANYCLSMGRILASDSGRVMCVTNMTFDIFLAEGLLPLSMGRTVVMTDEDERTLPWRMAQRLASSGATTMQITPSQLQMCLGNDEFRAAVKNVKLLLLAGEASNARLVEETAKYTSARQVDVYGPTEATVYVSSSRLAPGEPVTIGQPFDNCRMYVLDEARHEVFPTARGELYLAGVCLAEGYVGRPDLTQAAFVDDPMFPGERMYRTGDIARLKADGDIDCLGRRDAQIKLNGLRIELDEINGAATDSGVVTQCVTVPVQRPDGSAFLRAFAVPADRDADAENKLRAHMRTLLPEYMLPAEFVMLDALPSNASGKVDLPRLKAWEPAPAAPQATPDDEIAAPSKPAAAAEASPAGGADIENVRRIWMEELDRQTVSDSESFFSQGGTSLAALGVLTKYYSAGISMTLAEFYANPTIAGQAELFRPHAEPAPRAEAATKAEDTFVPRPAPSEEPAAPSLPAKTVLLTGASGFLGAHILRELMESGLADEVACLMRDDGRDRLLGVLDYYFGRDWTLRYAGRISAVKGDIGKARFGLDEGEYGALCRRTDAVFHTAADVRHFAADNRAWMTNVFGTAHTAQFALDAGAALNHISTISVSGEYLVRDRRRSAVFTEADFNIGQNWHDNIYVEGKFLAEQEIYDRIAAGLNARVHRLGRLVGRDSDGAFQKNPASNAVYLTLRGIQAAGALPRAMADVSIDLTPVDYCARAIVALSQGPMPVSHIADPAPVTMLQAVRAIDPEIEVIDDAAFSALLARLLPEDSRGYLPPLVEIWNRGMHDGPAMITQNWDKTTEELRKLGVEMPHSPPETRLKAYSIGKEGGIK